MITTETESMARTKGRTAGKKAAAAPQVPVPRTTIINLKGTPEQAAWLEEMHRETYISKSVIVRLALTLWAERNGRRAFPSADDD